MKLICMLSEHPLYDTRLTKYGNSFLSSGYNVMDIHFYGDAYKEENRKIQFPVGFLMKRRLYFFFGLKAMKLLKEKLYGNTDIIFHIHDPIVLNLIKKIKRSFPGSYIIYDRHEYYENYYTFGFFQEFSFYESFYKKHIDLIIFTSHAMKESAERFFKGKTATVVNNYPLEEKNLNRAEFYNKKDDILTISYVGSLQWKVDRDISIMLKMADVIEDTGINYSFCIAGETRDNELLSLFKEKEIKTQNRFQFLGVLSRDQAIELTVRSHIGLNFLYPSYSHKQYYSANKIYEYIYFGVIPFVRIKAADIDIKDYTDYAYTENTDDTVVLKDFGALVKNKDIINSKIEMLLNREYNFFWENEFKNIGIYL